MITSASNKSIKNVQALLSKAKERKKQGVFVVDRLETRFDGLEEKVDRLETRFDGLEVRFDGLEEKVDRLETRFDSLEVRFDGLEEKVDRIDAKTDRIEKRITDEMEDTSHMIKTLFNQTDRITNYLDLNWNIKKFN